MADGKFEDGYRDGWASAAGDTPLPDERTHPEDDESEDYQTGFLYGRSDALERGFTP
jgi:hypothetical protein